MYYCPECGFQSEDKLDSCLQCEDWRKDLIHYPPKEDEPPLPLGIRVNEKIQSRTTLR